MFDFSIGKFVLTVTAGSYLIGRKHLPKVAYAAGGYMGKGVGNVIRMKQEFWKSTQDTELVRLHKEFQEGVDELQHIRSELTSVSALQQNSPMSSASKIYSTSLNDLVDQHHQQSVRNTAATTATPPTGGTPESVGATDISPSKAIEIRLALAEQAMQQEQTTYVSKLDQKESGADYICSSITDSLIQQAEYLQQQAQTPLPKSHDK